MATPELLVQLTVEQHTALIAEVVDRVLQEREQKRGRKSELDEAPATFKEALGVLRCSERTLRKFIALKKIEVMKLGNGGSSRVLIARSELVRFQREARQ